MKYVALVWGYILAFAGVIMSSDLQNLLYFGILLSLISYFLIKELDI